MHSHLLDDALIWDLDGPVDSAIQEPLLGNHALLRLQEVVSDIGTCRKIAQESAKGLKTANSHLCQGPDCSHRISHPRPVLAAHKAPTAALPQSVRNVRFSWTLALGLARFFVRSGMCGCVRSIAVPPCNLSHLHSDQSCRDSQGGQSSSRAGACGHRRAWTRVLTCALMKTFSSDNPRSRSTEDIATGHWPAARGAPINERTKV